mmetsp:Transcript_5902/g.12898  ORF Transcript_5902/g.12898 Transcript_5902/m.12898 type:complete len:239 (+) Transcript_5902:491-1207(+)
MHSSDRRGNILRCGIHSRCRRVGSPLLRRDRRPRPRRPRRQRPHSRDRDATTPKSTADAPPISRRDATASKTRRRFPLLPKPPPTAPGGDLPFGARREWLFESIWLGNGRPPFHRRPHRHLIKCRRLPWPCSGEFLSRRLFRSPPTTTTTTTTRRRRTKCGTGRTRIPVRGRGRTPGDDGASSPGSNAARFPPEGSRRRCLRFRCRWREAKTTTSSPRENRMMMMRMETSRTSREGAW